MELSEKQLIKAYVADLLKNQVAYLENQIEGLIYEENIEYLHHTRVMSRRIRNTISLFTPYIGKKTSKKWFGSMKKLTKSLTNVRDLDVQIQFLEDEISGSDNQKNLAGLQRLILRKRQKREKHQGFVKSAVLEFEKSKTLPEIQYFISENPFDLESFVPPDALIILGKDEVTKLTKNCFSFLPFITNPENSESLHNLRIAVKNLRYTVELYQPVLPQLDSFVSTFKKFQDDLGVIHDCDVWLAELDKFLKNETKRIKEFYGQTGPINFIKPGIVDLKEKLLNKKIDIHNQFLNRWNEEYQNQFWTKLHNSFEKTNPETN